MSTTPSITSKPSTGQAQHKQANRTPTLTQAQVVTDAPTRAAPPQPTADSAHEMFVSCSAAQAMQQKFEHQPTEFIAFHDIGTVTASKLLAGVAAASGRTVQRLVIRRQGYGNALATLEFIDFQSGGQSLRIYTTEAEADLSTRGELAHVLLNYSRLGVVLVGDFARPLATSAFGPLREAMLSNSWRNRQMLLLPLAASSAISGNTALGQGTGVTVRTTPQVTRPAQAWEFISGSWNRLRAQIYSDTGRALLGLPGAGASAPGTAASASVKNQPQAIHSQAAPLYINSAQVPLSSKLPTLPDEVSPLDAVEELPLVRYANQLGELPGIVSVAIFDIQTGQSLVYAGEPNHDALAQQGASLFAAMAAASQALSMGKALPEAAITLATHHLMLRGVPNYPGLALHAVLDKTRSNPTEMRLRILRLDASLASISERPQRRE